MIENYKNGKLESTLKPVVQYHHDGFGLNDALIVYADERDAFNGMASHEYTILYGEKTVAEIQFQHGPRREPGSKFGVTEAALLTVLIDRLEGFQSGPFSCKENELMLTKLKEALFWVRERAENRFRRGVLGKNEK